MKRTGIMGLALVVALALGAVAGASAYAHEFVASTTGTLTGTAKGLHLFKTEVGTLECKVASGKGTVTALKAETEKVAVEYKECKLTEPFEGSATVKPAANYLLSANGPISNETEVKVESASCTLTILGGQSALKEVKYANLAGGKVEVKATVKGIEYKTAGVCGTKTSKTGEYAGSEEVSLAGGTIEWK
jgi:hypothetical protein